METSANVQFASLSVLKKRNASILRLLGKRALTEFLLPAVQETKVAHKIADKKNDISFSTKLGKCIKLESL